MVGSGSTLSRKCTKATKHSKQIVIRESQQRLRSHGGSAQRKQNELRHDRTANVLRRKGGSPAKLDEQSGLLLRSARVRPTRRSEADRFKTSMRLLRSTARSLSHRWIRHPRSTSFDVAGKLSKKMDVGICCNTDVVPPMTGSQTPGLLDGLSGRDRH
jgi:hypothetical protein